ncbi:hypothetical protein Nepgr_031548 [Nepenthes gracilis]|uniref:Uncharacterized protein n=1 Tax=Nepenthes gracilis TaxID=150966 RepID=A0AAD3TGX9_NEPGR|nr:hypothetical protein Nepgr_031548 [Nepenthes gracilis]
MANGRYLRARMRQGSRWVLRCLKFQEFRSRHLWCYRHFCTTPCLALCQSDITGSPQLELWKGLAPAPQMMCWPQRGPHARPESVRKLA